MCNVESVKCKVIIGILIYFVLHITPYTLHKSFAQDSDKLAALTKQVMETKNDEELYDYISELTEPYYKENKYNECVEQLKSLGQRKEGMGPEINYFMALSRYNQLKYWEDSQSWNEYFSQGNLYRGEIESLLEDAINKTTAKNPFNAYAKLLLWKLYNNQGSDLSDKALSGLKDSVTEYSQDTTNIILIKNVADALLSMGEKLKSKELYKIYVDKLVSANKEVKTLEPIALDFYNQGNLELSEAIYDTFIERSLKSSPKKN